MRKARILLYDIETSPNVAYIWGKYEQNALGDFIQERKMISVAWKWLGEKKVHVAALPMFPGYSKNPESNTALVRLFHSIISQADIVVGHNAKSFDEKMVNADFIHCGLKPPPPHKVIDTLLAARSRFRFNSNKLDDLGERLNLGRKMEHGGFKLWLGCLKGDRASWKTMMRYNKQDVVLLEKVYLKLRPWMTNHPNLSHYSRVESCPSCESENTERRGWSYTKKKKKQRIICRDCGSWFLGDIKGTKPPSKKRSQ